MNTDINWMESAVCRQTDSELFFPDRENPNTDGFITSIRRAQTVCRSCPVQTECLDYALSNNEKAGIWAGINFSTAKAHTREELRRQRGVQVREVFSHGTEAGARAHYRRGEPACPSCRNAAAAADRNRRGATNAR
jgi:WhiB family redox-sensing transcriptional regulator